MERDQEKSEGMFGTFNGPPDQPEYNGPGDAPTQGSDVPSFFSRDAAAPPPEVAPSTDSMSAFITKTMAAVTDADEPLNDDQLLPPAPRTFSEVGLSKAFLTDLTLKILHYSGTPSMSQLVRRLGLNSEIVQQIISSLTEERLVEILSQSDLYTGNYRYRLSERGQTRVNEALERSRYAGPAPVTAEQYNSVMKRLLEHSQDTSSRARIKSILHDLVLDNEVSDSLARALFSGKSMILYGPSGNGKTVLMERYAEDMGGFSFVPYAIYAYGQVIRVYDQSIHEPLEKQDDENVTRDEARRDRRWVVIKRPAIVLGAEMDKEALDLGYDPSARFYQAPPHIKAQNGALIIDDFGRQQIPTRDLLTRWLIPSERGWDSLTLVTGEKLQVPFKVQLLFSTNMRVKDLADDALLRRILYKVSMPNPSATNFAEILRQSCRQRKVRVEDGALEHAVDRLYNHPQLRPRASYARDLLDMLCESAAFDGHEPVLDIESFDRVFQLFAMQEEEEDALDQADAHEHHSSAY
jgi:predicted ATPase with chaperone activity